MAPGALVVSGGVEQRGLQGRSKRLIGVECR
jgi:hypothetical protein